MSSIGAISSHEDALRLVERRAAGQRRFGSRRADDRRRDAAERDPHGAGRWPAGDVGRRSGGPTPAMTIFEIACAARVPTFRNHCVPRIAGISKPTISSSGRRTVWR